jgi:phosphogluconate dehydratase
MQDEGLQVALVTDGRMSGASGKVPAAIHLTPEALLGGPIGKIRNGDVIRLDAVKGELSVLVAQSEWQARPAAVRESLDSEYGTGRELFAHMRRGVSQAELGASMFEG